MSRSNSFENSLLSLIFKNQAIENIGDAGGLLPSVVAGNFYIRLHTDAVVVDDSTLGTEAAYTGYVAGGVAVPRSAAGWTVSGNQASNAAVVTFGECTAGSETIRYISVWKNNSSSVDTDRLFWGQLTLDLDVSAGITPEFSIGSIDVNED